MELILTRTLKSVSVQQFYHKVWSEGQQTDAKPFYGPFLADMGSMKVSVNQWEFAKEGQSFQGRWCGEAYQQRRRIRFEFKRTTHLYVGPPIAIVHQTHYCRCEGDNKCVLAMTVEMEGIPYADCFAVEIRWVARRVGVNDLSIEVGLFVDFKKSTMFAKQIRSGTVVETKPIHLKLLEKAIQVCSGTEVVNSENVGTTEDAILAEDTSTKENSVLDNVQVIALRVMKQISEGDPVTLGVTFLFVFLMFRWLMAAPPPAETVLTDDTQTLEVIELRRQVADLQAEVQLMHDTIKNLVEAVKAKD
uniref:VASt domain-containing protein n=1 Tax=Cyclophora tenuis TaxID=216820 RepID=A0A6U1PIV5_CYCTE